MDTDGNETQPEVFAVARIVRDWQYRLRLVGDGGGLNLATPAVLGRVLDELHALTSALEAKDAARRGSIFVPYCDALCLELRRWRVRLDYYRARVAEASPDDRAAILWEVTNPLFFGWHGGRTGVEVALPEGGYPETFNTVAQHGADVATPYSLANQLAVSEDWEARRVALMSSDFWEEAGRVGGGVAVGLGVSHPWVVAGLAMLAVTSVSVAAYRLSGPSRR